VATVKNSESTCVLRAPTRCSSRNFSPAGSTSELEDYEVYLDGVSALELVIRPDLTHNDGLATFAAWRVA
jgi:hypothetical protein